jgi:antirestriction protein ArdC
VRTESEGIMSIYDIVTERILKQLEAGVIPWRKTWRGAMPVNYVSRKQYRGVNLLLLPHGGEWLTFKQAQDMGGTVKKGEKASVIVFYKTLEKENEEGEKKKFPYLQYSNVFHLSQCEGIESKMEDVFIDETLSPIQKSEDIIAEYVKRSGVTIRHIEGGYSASYRQSDDSVTMPLMGQFASIEEYYSTFFHELAHSTGHKNRLNRLSENTSYGGASYSREELIAEISTCFTMNVAGIEISETFDNSVAYIQAWIKHLRNDKMAIVSASGKAQSSTNLILGIETE